MPLPLDEIGNRITARGPWKRGLPQFFEMLVALGRAVRRGGSGPGFKRPVLVVQANAFNSSKIASVVVAVITSNLALAEAPGNLRIAKSDSGLPQPSVVNVSQIITIDKSVLTTRVKSLPSSDMVTIDEGVKLVLALP